MLYALCKMFLKSHAPGIEALTNESVFKIFNCGRGFKCMNESMILSENAKRTQYRMNV